jgi:tRNA A64-2'-O-ribosylphosphate transferase
MWITPESEITSMGNGEVFQDWHPVICCTASRRVPGGEVSEGGYIQGSGDDTENWAYGLTPPVFWANTSSLLSESEEDLPSFIAELLAVAPLSGLKNEPLIPVTPTTSLYITSMPVFLSQQSTSSLITILLSENITPESSWETSNLQLSVGIGPHKIGSKNLRTALPIILEFLQKKINQSEVNEGPEILIVCSSGKDHSVGVGLAILCLLYDDLGHLERSSDASGSRKVDKLFIRRRLGWIMTAMPDSNPSRSTLQSVNSYLMERPRHW